MIRSDMITFGGAVLDRAAHLRDEAEPLAARSDARYVVMWRGRPLFDPDRGTLYLVDATHPVLLHATAQLFLGRSDATAYFAIEIADWAPESVVEDGVGLTDPDEHRHPDCATGVFTNLRAVMAGLSALDAELAATARALFEWHHRHRFCSACGCESHMSEAGWLRICPDCDTRHFPRTDPVVIMLITCGNRVLLGRSPGWPDGMYSLLAGFVEPGETIEAASRREAWEEAGVRLGQVDYLACQPWPFPSSLMIATRAEARAPALTLDPAEIEDARWLTREQVFAVHAGTSSDILPSRKGAIAGFILQNWLADRLD